MARRNEYTESVRSRFGTRYSPYYKPMTYTHCRDCGRTLVSQREWADLTAEQRSQRRIDGEEVHAGQGYCQKDYQRRRRAGTIRCHPRPGRPPALPEHEVTRLRRLTAHH